MKRTKSPHHTAIKKSLKHKKSGVRSSCTQNVIEQTAALCKLGLTDWQLAEYFKVASKTIEYWKNTNSAFAAACDKGRMTADARVADALYKKATGYYHKETKFFKTRVTEKFFDQDGYLVSEKSYDKIVEHPFTAYYPPDTKAAIKILNSRHRELWGEHFKVNHTHLHGTLEDAGLDPKDVLNQIADGNEMTDEELQLIAKWGLQDKTEVPAEVVES